jgi:chromosome segregation ATPase
MSRRKPPTATVLVADLAHLHASRRAWKATAKTLVQVNDRLAENVASLTRQRDEARAGHENATTKCAQLAAGSAELRTELARIRNELALVRAGSTRLQSQKSALTATVLAHQTLLSDLRGDLIQLETQGAINLDTWPNAARIVHTDTTSETAAAGTVQ